MTKRDAVVLVSRVIGLYLLIWALDAATYIPGHAFSFAHYRPEYSVVLGGSYLRSLYRIDLVADVVRAIALLAVSALFFHAGPRLQAVLLPAEDKASS